MVRDTEVSVDRGESGGYDVEGKERRDFRTSFLCVGSASTYPAARFCRWQAGVSAALRFSIHPNKTVQKPILPCKVFSV